MAQGIGRHQPSARPEKTGKLQKQYDVDKKSCTGVVQNGLFIKK
jgi:hypothetical protein